MDPPQPPPPFPGAPLASVDVYSTLTWLLLAVVLLLLILLASLWVAARRRARSSSGGLPYRVSKGRTTDDHTPPVFTLGSGLGSTLGAREVPGPRPGSGPKATWRDSLANYKL